MVATALFDIDDDGEDGGFQASANQTLTLKLRAPIDSAVNTVLFQVYSPGGYDEDLGIAANPPLASKGAPVLTLHGAMNGQAVSPSTVGGSVTVTLPGSVGHSWIVRCVVNSGQRTLASGKVVVDLRLVHERGVYINTSYGTRKVVATELFQFSEGGWADAVNDLIALGASAAVLYTPPGLGAEQWQIDAFLNQGIHALSFMNTAERAAALSGSLAVNHAPALQRAIDYAFASNAPGSGAPGPKLNLGGCTYRLDGPIHVGYGISFGALVVEGEGMRYGGSGTRIVATHDDAPAIVVQGGRNVKLKGFTIEGENYAHCVGVRNAPDMTTLDLATWIAPGLSNERYRPYVGIAIDPYCGARPAQSYPDVAYPGYLGAVPQYGKEASSNTKIEDVAIFGFVGGIGQQTCDYDGNGDYTKLERVLISFCAWGMSWGNSQSRVMRWGACQFVGMHTGFFTDVHGRQQGKPSVTITDSEFSSIIKAFDIGTLSFGEGPTFTGCFGEGMYSLGRLAGFRVAGGVVFKGCEWGFSWWQELGVPAAVLQHAGTGLVRFENCNLFNPIGRGTFHFDAEGFDADINQLEPARLFAFDGCEVVIRDAAADSAGTTHLWAKAALGGTLGITIAYGSTTLHRFGVQIGDLSDLDTGALLGPRFISERSQGRRDRPLCAYVKRAASLATGNDPGLPVAWRTNSITINGGTPTQVGREVEFQTVGINLQYLMMLGGDVGDVLICQRTKAVFWVEKRTADVITARAQTGFDTNGDLLMPLVNGDVFWAINCRRYMPETVLYGDITSGSPTISNVVDGGGGNPADIGVHVTVGDYLFVDEEMDRVMPALTAGIASFNNGAHTITMDSNFTQTRTRMRLGPFVRLAMPNGP